MKTILILRICLILLSICFISYVSCENQIVLNPECNSEQATGRYKNTWFVFMIGGVGDETTRKKIFYVLKQLACSIPISVSFKFNLLDYASEEKFESNTYNMEELQELLKFQFKLSTNNNPCDKYKEGLKHLKDNIQIPQNVDDIHVFVQISTAILSGNCRPLSLFINAGFSDHFHLHGIKLTQGDRPVEEQQYVDFQYEVIQKVFVDNKVDPDLESKTKKFIDDILETRKVTVTSPTTQPTTQETTKTPDPTTTATPPTTADPTTNELTTQQLTTTETPIPGATDPPTIVQTTESTTTEGTTSEAIVAVAEPVAEEEKGSNAWIYVIVIFLILLIIVAALVVAFCYVRRKKKPEEHRLLPTVTASESKSKSIVIEPPTVPTSPAITPSPLPSPMPKVFPVAKKRSATIVSTVSTVKVAAKEDNEDALAFLKNKKRDDVEKERSTLSTSITLESICDRKKKAPGSKDLQKTQSLPSADKK